MPGGVVRGDGCGQVALVDPGGSPQRSEGAGPGAVDGVGEAVEVDGDDDLGFGRGRRCPRKGVVRIAGRGLR